MEGLVFLQMSFSLSFFSYLGFFGAYRGGAFLNFPDPCFCFSPPLSVPSLFFFLGGRGFLYRNWNLSLGAGFTFVHGVAGGGVKVGMMGEKGGVFLLVLELKKSSSLSFDSKNSNLLPWGRCGCLPGVPLLWFCPPFSLILWHNVSGCIDGWRRGWCGARGLYMHIPPGQW